MPGLSSVLIIVMFSVALPGLRHAANSAAGGVDKNCGFTEKEDGVVIETTLEELNITAEECFDKCGKSSECTHFVRSVLTGSCFTKKIQSGKAPRKIDLDADWGAICGVKPFSDSDGALVAKLASEVKNAGKVDLDSQEVTQFKDALEDLGELGLKQNSSQAEIDKAADEFIKTRTNLTTVSDDMKKGLEEEIKEALQLNLPTNASEVQIEAALTAQRKQDNL